MCIREEIERQRDASNYRRLHEAGRTEEARRDLARLAIIRQQREEAARKKEAERKGVCHQFCRVFTIMWQFLIYLFVFIAAKETQAAKERKK